ncbi:hypothetical protein MishRS11D_35820 [Methylomagnum ishizawai]|nr:hypothetical protein MishRS11D_35820 [Methylomagnum ishizawai]
MVLHGRISVSGGLGRGADLGSPCRGRGWREEAIPYIQCGQSDSNKRTKVEARGGAVRRRQGPVVLVGDPYLWDLARYGTDVWLKTQPYGWKDRCEGGQDWKKSGQGPDYAVLVAPARAEALGR